MPLTRDQKQQVVSEYTDGLALAQHAFVLGFQGISVPQVTELRARIRARGASYAVVKNSLVLRAVEGRPLAQLAGHFRGPTAIAFSNDDPVALAKVLTDFAKEAPVLEFRAGLVEGRPVSGSEVKEIAGLPSREQLLAKLVFLLQSSITRFVRVLAAVPQQLVTVLDQVRSKREGQD